MAWQYIAVSGGAQRATYPDEYIEYWCNIYVQQNVSAHKIKVEQFLVDPERILRRLDNLDAALEELNEIHVILAGQEVHHATAH